MKKFFISGIPATLKTTIGDYLEMEYNFFHFNMETYMDKYPDPNQNPLWSLSVDEFIEKINPERKDIVITGGIDSNHPKMINIIKSLKVNGFKLIKLNAEERLAKDKFIYRDGNSNGFDEQIVRMKGFNKNNFNGLTEIEVLDANGYKDTKAIVEIIFSI